MKNYNSPLKINFSILFYVTIIVILLINISCSKSKRFEVRDSRVLDIKATTASFVAQAKGNVNKIDEVGFCYIQGQVPVYGDNTIIAEKRTRTNKVRTDITADVKNLKANTEYNVRAFSKLNDGSIFYGKLLTFFTNNEYVIGDTGPAGGIVFGGYPDGYLEAVLIKDIKKNFGCDNIQESGTSYKFGFGYNNSILINQKCGSSSAASYCLNLNYNGYDDWFMPSLDELKTVTYAYDYSNKTFRPSGIYWSSTEYNKESAYAVDLTDGSDRPFAKTENFGIVAIRIIK